MSRTLLFLLVAVAVLTVKTTAKNNDDYDDWSDKGKYFLYEMLIKLFDLDIQREPMPEWVEKGWKAYKGETDFHHYFMLVQFSLIETDVDTFSETSKDFSDSFGSVISDLYEFDSVKAQVLGTKDSGDDEISVLVLVQYATNDETEDRQVDLERCSKSLSDTYNVQDVERRDERGENEERGPDDEFFYYYLMSQNQNNDGQVDLNSLIIYLASQENEMDAMMRCVLMSQGKQGREEQSQRKDEMDKWMWVLMMAALQNDVDADVLLQYIQSKNNNDNKDEENSMWDFIMAMLENKAQRKNDDMLWYLTIMQQNQQLDGINTNDLLQCIMSANDDNQADGWYYYMLMNGRNEDGNAQRKENDFLKYYFLLQNNDQDGQMDDLFWLFLDDDKDDDLFKYVLLMNNQGQNQDGNDLFWLFLDDKDNDFFKYWAIMNQQQNQRSEDGAAVQRKDDDLFKYLMLFQNQGQNAAISDNCLNLLLLLGDDKEDENILMYYMLQQQGQQQQQRNARNEDGEVQDTQRGKGMEMMLMWFLMGSMNDNKNNNGGFNVDMSSMFDYYIQSGGELPPEMWMFMLLNGNANQQGREERKEDNKFLYYFLLNSNQNTTESCDQALLWLLALDDKQEDDFFIYYLLQQQRESIDVSEKRVDSDNWQAARGKDDESEMLMMMMLMQLMQNGGFNLDFFQDFMKASKKGIDATNVKGHSTGTIVGVVVAFVVLAAFGIVAAAMVVYVRRARKRREYQNVPLIQNESDERRGLMTWSGKSQANKENLVI